MELHDEEWRQIPGFPEHLISTNGDVLGPRKKSFLRPIFDKTGRARIRLTNGYKTKSIYVHDLMVDVFLGGRPEDAVIIHKNGNGADNRLSNIDVVYLSDQNKSTDGQVWADIKGYEGYYQVSTNGNVRTLARFVNSRGGDRAILGRPTRVVIGLGGYPCAYLSKGRETKCFYIHRLVAEAFIPNPQNLPEINHKDETRTNARVDNLEWCDHVYNMNYGTIKERKTIALKKTNELKRKQSSLF